MKKVNLFRLAVLVAGGLAAAYMTIWPTLDFAFINPAPAYANNPSAGLAELRDAAVGWVLLASPFIIYWLTSRKRRAAQIILAGVVLTAMAMYGHVKVAAGNSTAGVAYILYFLPLELLSIPVAYLVAYAATRLFVPRSKTRL